jgi:hypothetical protein
MSKYLLRDNWRRDIRLINVRFTEGDILEHIKNINVRFIERDMLEHIKYE